MGNNNSGLSCHYCFRPSTEVKLKQCPLCKQPTCIKCLENPLVMESDRESLKVTSLCRPCFKKNVSIDFDKKVEIIGEQNKNTIIWIHGGGSCRKMFEVHAKFLANKGYRSILIDLPGHGSLMDQKLTIENCKQVVHDIRMKYCSEPPLLVGGSFGGFIIMELMNDYWQTSNYTAAVIMMCGQNVGEGRSWKASLGMWGMQKAIHLLSSETLVKGLAKAAKNVDKPLLADLLRAGYYFHQGDQQIQILTNSNPEKGLQKFTGPILFINGSQDHRDSQQRWMKASKNGQLKVYEGADHFFSHDKRYIDRLQTDLLEFADKVFNLKERKDNNSSANDALHQ